MVNEKVPNMLVLFSSQLMVNCENMHWKLTENVYKLDLLKRSFPFGVGYREN